MKSISASSFYKEIRKTLHIWALQSDEGLITYLSSENRPSVYVWSSRDRIIKIIENEKEFKSFRPLEIPWVYLENQLLEEFVNENYVILINWVGNGEKEWEETAEEFSINMTNAIAK